MADLAGDDAGTSKMGEWRRGWPIVLASLVGIALCLSPLPYWALIIIGPELAREFGWSREVITAGFLFMTSGVLIGAPVAGQLVDRYGARKVLLPSIVALGLGTMAFSQMTNDPRVFYLIFFITAVLGSATLPITWTKAIVNNFDRYRGLALGIALTGTGLYGFIASPTIQAMINAFGWRWAYVGVGALPLILSLPLAIILFRDEKEDRQLADVDTSMERSLMSWIWVPILIAIALCAVVITVLSTPNGAQKAIALMAAFFLAYVGYVYMKSKQQDVNPMPGLTVKEIYADYRFWVILFCFMLLGAVVSGIIANSKFILLDKGYTANQSASLLIGAGVIGLSTMVGRLVGGYLVDRIWAPLIGFVFLSVPAVGCWILMGNHPVALNVVALILVGLAAGVEFDLMAYFVSRYFGMKSYGRIYGLIYAAFGLGSGTSPIIFNLIRGDSPDYSGVLMLASFGFLIGGALLLTLGKYRDFGLDPHAH
ncbi:MFS transporter [Algimonas porphyrae]|uniref:MFS transporter n=1 Tax=Algimonas porphyrae TaxID=1128113 RepID=A0ABQ5UXY8_9PROT|nr:MFS transporter [Algimonas porphyrae]GLQ20178.1 MFS transporter [Algimonas porphyrae]